MSAYSGVLARDRGGIVDAGLAGTERARRIACAVPFYANAPEFLTGSDAILNVGRRLAKKMATLHKLHSFELPLKVPGFEIAMLWNRRNAPSQARSWLRKLIERCAGDDDTRQR